MSRGSNLYWQAAAKATPPFRRLYLDTEPLRCGDWPRMSNQLGFCLRVAGHMGVGLYIPEPALYERNEQWIREALAKLEVGRAEVKDARKYVQPLGASVSFEVPVEAEIRTRYASVQQKALAEFRIRGVPYASRPLDEVFRMAVQRVFTFEDSKAGVVGLQDCVILLSVLDHLCANPASAALVSNDAVFSRIPALTPEGVDLHPISGLAALEKTLDEAVSAALSAELTRWWTEEAERIRQVLTTQHGRIRGFLEESIGSSEIEKLFVGRVLAVEPPTIESLGRIRPELAGLADEPLRFSCDLRVSYTATVEQQFSSLLAALVGGQQPPTESTPARQTTEHRTVTIELGAQVSPDYSNLALQTAHLRA